MGKYWPKRNDAEGFSIEKLAKRYRSKLNDVSFANKTAFPSKESKTEELLSNKDGFSEEDPCVTNRQKIKTMHWANRDFSEYFNAA